MLTAFRKRSVSALVAGLSLFLAPAALAAEKSQCALCHTSVKELVDLTRKLQAGRPAEESKSKGPG